MLTSRVGRVRASSTRAMIAPRSDMPGPALCRAWRMRVIIKAVKASSVLSTPLKLCFTATTSTLAGSIRITRP